MSDSYFVSLIQLRLRKEKKKNGSSPRSKMTQPPQPRHSFFTPSFLPSFALIPTQIWWTMSSPQAEEAEEVVASQSEQARSRLRTIVTVLSLLFFSTLLLSSPVSPILLRSTLQLHTFPSAITLSSAKVAQSLNQSFILWDEPAASIDVRVIRHAIGYPLKATVIFAHVRCVVSSRLHICAGLTFVDLTLASFRACRRTPGAPI